MKFGSLFSGIGGLDLGLERAGMTCVWQVEKDPFCQALLARRFPHTLKFGDVRRRRDYPRVDMLVGGFPCQPISTLGLRKGKNDERWLWPYFNAIIGQLLPNWVLIENVEGLRANGFQEVLEGLACSGYDAEWDRIPASSVGAPHIRFRYFIVAYRTNHPVQAKGKLGRSSPNIANIDGRGRESDCRIYRKSECRAYALNPCGGNGKDAGTNCSPLARLRSRNSVEPVAPEKSFARYGWWAVEPGVVRMANGVPYAVDRIAGLGNAVVPQVAEWIGRRIVAAAAEEVTSQ